MVAQRHEGNSALLDCLSGMVIKSRFPQNQQVLQWNIVHEPLLNGCRLAPVRMDRDFVSMTYSSKCSSNVARLHIQSR